VQRAAQAFGQQLVVVEAIGEAEIETAFAMFVERAAGALTHRRVRSKLVGATDRRAPGAGRG